ncbi:tetratricopeptide repeat protein [Rhodobacterales bacterium HKCCE2091]|nr:tetratricopeptide repeat protein [Rhodobacterales bacterium HKCCE2091]
MRLVLALSLALALPGLASAQGSAGFSGAYLAARQAVIDGDHRAAARYFEEALRDDPGNRTLIENAVLARAALGDWDRALEIAGSIPADAEGRELANIVEQVDRVRNGDYEGALAAIAEGRAAGPLVDDLSRAWLMLGQGEMSAASDVLTDLAAPGPLAEIAQYHLALIRAAVGDFEGADAILSGEEFGPQPASVRGIRAHALVLVQLDRRDDALELLDNTTASVPDPALLGLRDQIAVDEGGAYDFIVTPEEGVAEVFFTIARGLGTDSGGPLALIYARAARVLDPGNTDAVLLGAEMLENEGQLALAAETYREVPQDDPLSVAAELRRASALFETGREDTAVEVLERLARDHPDVSTIHATLGDTLRRMERFDEAIGAYTAALDLVDTSQTRYWFLFYTRAIAYERTGAWEEAEADFRQALSLSPEQPQVLNYLGYSLVEQNRNLDEALDMIERAVAAEPQSGYIVDSLGWVYYRLGRFDEAVEPMERAVELVPTDPILNDHLGDVYWMVGRTREARFQWNRALSFDPEEADAERIRLKLEIGLDEVLEREGAADAE